LDNPLFLIDTHELRAGIWNNFQKVVEGCMQAKGFYYRRTPSLPPNSSYQYFPSSETGDFTPDFNAATASTFVLAPALASTQGVGETNARSYMTALRGYQLPAGGERKVYQYDWRAYDGASLPNFGYLGKETGGCEAEGRRLVTEPAAAALKQIDLLAAPLLETLLASEESEMYGSAWVDCMSARGYAYRDFMEPGVEFRSRPPLVSAPIDATQGPTQAETSSVSSLAGQEAEVGEDFQACMDSSGMTNFIDTTVAAEWDAFKAQHLGLLRRAGGMTLAETAAGAS
jgi:hypothetical protein